MASLSRKTNHLWTNFLLKDVNIGLSDLCSFYCFLSKRDTPDTLGDQVTTLTLVPYWRNELDYASMSNFANLFDLPLGTTPKAVFLEAITRVTELILERLVKLEILIDHLHFRSHEFGTRSTSTSSLIPFPFMNTIKKLCVSMDPEKTFDRLLSARNVTWLMIFCPNLEKLCTAFYFSKEDLDYLEVHETVLSGLSKVKELSLRFSYGYDKNDRRSWWGLPSESKRSWEGNGKTESIGRLLEITDQLQSLELFQLKNRKALLKDPLFISERIKVRTMKPGEISECA